jgi:hypothetical protein
MLSEDTKCARKEKIQEVSTNERTRILSSLLCDFFLLLLLLFQSTDGVKTAIPCRFLGCSHVNYLATNGKVSQLFLWGLQ